MEFELAQVRYLFQVHQDLLVRDQQAAPTAVELSALAMMLHSFYTGMENILKRIVIESGGEMPRGEHWHRLLLDAAARPGATGVSVISRETHELLSDYLAFRHVVRNAYAFDLDWEKLRPLVRSCEGTFARFSSDVRSFLEGGNSQAVTR